MDDVRKKPVVFVSSTCYDLKQVREDLKDFFEGNYGFETMLSEFDSFPVSPCAGTFENCLNNVDQCADIFVLIVGMRYGYVTESGKSITNLEYLHAKAKGIPIFVFINKELDQNWRVWKNNPAGDFSRIVEDPKIFEFVSVLREGSQQWIYTFDSARDIKMALKNQLILVFSDGLKLHQIVTNHKLPILNGDVSADAARMIIEQPFAWEYKFLAYTLKYEFVKIQKNRWDFKSGVFEGHTLSLEDPSTLLGHICDKLKEILKVMQIFTVILNETIKEAIGEPNVPSDLELMIYASKQCASIYKRLIDWALYFKSLHVDDRFSYLLQLLYELPISSLNKIDAFVDEVYREITSLPDVDDHLPRQLSLQCRLDGGNTDAINAEIERLANLLT